VLEGVVGIQQEAGVWKHERVQQLAKPRADTAAVGVHLPSARVVSNTSLQVGGDAARDSEDTCVA
jgi:hypothetical protein